MNAQSIKFTRNTELYLLKWHMLWYMNYISVKVTDEISKRESDVPISKLPIVLPGDFGCVPTGGLPAVQHFCPSASEHVVVFLLILIPGVSTVGPGYLQWYVCG